MISRIITSSINARVNRPQKGEANICAPVFHIEVEACKVLLKVLLKPKNGGFFGIPFFLSVSKPTKANKVVIMFYFHIMLTP